MTLITYVQIVDMNVALKVTTEDTVLVVTEVQSAISPEIISKGFFYFRRFCGVYRRRRACFGKI